MLEGSGISPFSQRGLDEAFGFAVGLRGVRLNPDVLDSELFSGAGEGFAEVAATIVSHDAFDGNAEAPEVGDGEVSRIDRANHPRLRHRSDRPICRRSSGSY